MKSAWLIAVAWLASVAGAWVLGGGGEKPSGPTTPDSVDRVGSVPSSDPKPTGPTTAPSPTLAGADRPAPVKPSAPANTPALREGLAAPVTLDLGAYQTGEEAVAGILAYARARLAEGPAGHLKLLETLDAMVRDKRLEALLGGSEEESVRHIYPMIKFAIANESGLLDMTETVFQTMADKPQALTSIDDDTLELFTEGFAFVLPAVASAEQIERLRGHAKKILATPEATQPDGVRKSRRDIERALVAWAPALSSDEALERLRSGSVEPAEALALIRRVAPDALRDVDVGSLIGPMIQAGNYDVLRALSRIPPEALNLGDLDRALLRSGASAQGWYIAQYLRVTGRTRWVDARLLIDAGLQAGGDVSDRFAESLLQLHERPPADYAEDALGRYSLSNRARNALQQIVTVPAPAVPR